MTTPTFEFIKTCPMRVVLKNKPSPAIQKALDTKRSNAIRKNMARSFETMRKYASAMANPQ